MVGVVVAMMVIVVSAYALMAVMVRASRDSAGSELGTVALYLATEKVEQIKSMAWDEVGPVGEADVSGFPGFRREVLVQLNGAGSIKEIRVVVRYVVSGGPEKIELVFEWARLY